MYWLKHFFYAIVCALEIAYISTSCPADMSFSQLSLLEKQTGTYVYDDEKQSLQDQTGFSPDYSDIDAAIQQYTAYSFSFQELVADITGNKDSHQKKIFHTLTVTFADVFRHNKNAVIQIIILAIFLAAVESFGSSIAEQQVSQLAGMMISIALMTILTAVFYNACVISEEVLETSISVYKTLIPVFFSAVAFVSGSTTAAVYYEIVLLLVTVVSLFFKNILFRVNQAAFFLTLADSVTKETRFTKGVTLLFQLIKWSCAATMIGFTGLSGLKSMVIPVSEHLKRSMAYKTFQIVPGIGNSVETIAQTILGTANVVKSGIGTAGVVVLLVICFIPVVKLVMIALLFKMTAALIEPVTGKKMAGAVESLGKAVGMYVYMIVVAVSMMMGMFAMVVLATNP